MFNTPLRSSHFAIALSATQIFALPGMPAVLEPPHEEGGVGDSISLRVSIVETPGRTEVNLRAEREDLAQLAVLLLGAVQFISGGTELGDLVLY